MDLQLQKLAFATHMVRQIIGADAFVAPEELAYLHRTFPPDLLREAGFVDGDGAFTPRFTEARDTAVLELADRLTLGEKLAMEIVDFNYPGYEAWFTVERLKQNTSPFLRVDQVFPDTILHELYGDVELELLSRDESQLRAAVNVYLRLGGERCLSPRIDIEMEKLQLDIRDLMTALMEEYP